MRRRSILLTVLLLASLPGVVLAGASVTVHRGNVVCKNAVGVTKTITTHHKDQEAVLSPDGHTVAFVRVVKATQHPEFPDDEITALWTGDCVSGTSRRVLAPSRGRDDFTDRLDDVGDPVFSLNGGYVYVSVAPGADYLILHQVNIHTGQHKRVAFIELDSVIRTGPYRGYLLATQHTDMTDAQGQHYGGYPMYIFRPDGTVVERIAGSEKWGEKDIKAWLKSKGWKAW